MSTRTFSDEVSEAVGEYARVRSTSFARSARAARPLTGGGPGQRRDGLAAVTRAL
jgi:hypothetical protein